MTTNQIYTLVNDVVKQGIGQNTITATDAQSLVALGNVVLSSNTNTEAFLNTLVQRIGKTILSFRDYRNKLADMTLDDFEYGMIVQKIAVKMPVAEADESYDLQNGASIDPWKISKPEVLQKFFVKRTPYKFRMTRSYNQLKEAFTSAEKMGGFIAICFGEVRNALEFALEELGRVTLANFMAETDKVVNLVTDFNTELNLTGADALTPTTALHSDLFLNYAIGRINHHAKMMTEMSIRYNDGSKPRFTPIDKRVIRLNSDFDTRCQTVTQYSAYHERFVQVGGVWDTMSYWQNFTEGQEKNIIVKRASDGTEKTINNIIGVIYDRDALGIYKRGEYALTTGWNADGAYENTVWHCEQLWFNDLSENFLLLTLN